MKGSSLAIAGQKSILIILGLQLVLIGFLVYNQFRLEQKLDTLAIQKTRRSKNKIPFNLFLQIIQCRLLMSPHYQKHSFVIY